MSQLAQCSSFDLPNSFSAHTQFCCYLLQGMSRISSQTEAHPEYGLLTV
jgi:hypothetical protein